MVVDDRSRKSNGDDIVFPILGDGLDSLDHLSGRKRWTGFKLSACTRAADEYLHVGTANINDQYFHLRCPYPTK
jgi:hypothetical protein